MWFAITRICLTLSTTEAAYVAMGESVKEAIPACYVLGFMQPGVAGQ